MNIFNANKGMPSEIENKISTEQMRMLYQNLPFNVILHLTAGFVLCTILWTKGDRQTLLLWWVIVACVALFRVTTYFYHRNREEKFSTGVWNALFGIGALISGFMWGVAGIILTPHEILSYELFVGFIIAGMAMGAVPVLSSVKEVYFCFALAAVLPYVVHLTWHEGEIYSAVAIIQCLFLLLMMVVAIRLNKLIKTSLLLQFFNVDLVEKLQGSNELLQGEVGSHQLTENKLRENEQRLSALVDATFEGIVLHREGIIVEANRGIAEMTGHSVNEIIGKPVVSLMAESCRDDVRKYIDSPYHSPFESMMCGNTDACFPVEIRSGYAPYRGEIVGFVVVRDITYYKELLKSQAAARHKAEEADQAKTEFLAAVSHELRTPLNAVMGFTQLLQGTSLSEEQAEYLSMTYQSGEQLLRLINDLLDLSRIESGRFDIELVNFNLREELSHILNQMSLKLAESGNILKLDIADNLPEYIEADPLRLRQILINLLGNAIKFTEHGTIEFSAYIGNKKLILIIKDSGKGIPEDKLEYVFGKFNQVDSSVSRSHGGAGLGLAISKSLVNAMQGEISVISKLHEGTSFKVELPVIMHDKNKLNDTSSEIVQELKTDYVVKKALSILLVEDDKTNQMIALAMLKKFGHAVTVAENGQRAIDLCQEENKFQLIFMDIQMPVMDGITATRRLREMGIIIPIVAMTANAMTGDREEYLKAGMSDYISKPIYKESLLALIEKFS